MALIWLRCVPGVADPASLRPGLGAADLGRAGRSALNFKFQDDRVIVVVSWSFYGFYGLCRLL